MAKETLNSTKNAWEAILGMLEFIVDIGNRIEKEDPQVGAPIMHKIQTTLIEHMQVELWDGQGQ